MGSVVKREQMALNIQISTVITLTLVFLCPAIHGWGVDGHFIICRIAQARLSEVASDAVKQLLPDYADNDLASVCSWADRVRFRYHWSAPLHFIDTPDKCTYQYERDCKDESGEKGVCVAGAINNYTNQLLTYENSSSENQYNLTEALLFLSHFMGDIHQPLHVAFTSDRGGNTINVHWYTRKTVLHHVWDVSIIETAEERFYSSSVENLINALERNITNEWTDLVQKWEKCSYGKTACPDMCTIDSLSDADEVHHRPKDYKNGDLKMDPTIISDYASESISAACDWAYKNVSEGSTLEDEYFLSRQPIVNLRLAEGGVRLAATLNRIFG